MNRSQCLLNAHDRNSMSAKETGRNKFGYAQLDMINEHALPAPSDTLR